LTVAKGLATISHRQQAQERTMLKWLIEHVNEFNKTSADKWKNEREGKNMLLEVILHEVGAYNGFSYLSAPERHDDAM